MSGLLDLLQRQPRLDGARPSGHLSRMSAQSGVRPAGRQTEGLSNQIASRAAGSDEQGARVAGGRSRRARPLHLARRRAGLWWFLGVDYEEYRRAVPTGSER